MIAALPLALLALLMVGFLHIATRHRKNQNLTRGHAW
jgi:hypothetical protein